MRILTGIQPSGALHLGNYFGTMLPAIRLQQERTAAFREYIADVHAGRFPERSHFVELEAPLLEEVMRELVDAPGK